MLNLKKRSYTKIDINVWYSFMLGLMGGAHLGFGKGLGGLLGKKPW